MDVRKVPVDPEKSMLLAPLALAAELNSVVPESVAAPLISVAPESVAAPLIVVVPESVAAPVIPTAPAVTFHWLDTLIP